ncbi:MAG: acyl-CoA dehydrogenase family protein [Anaerolineae bacterium]
MNFSIPVHVQEITRRVRQFIDSEVLPLEMVEAAHHGELPPEMIRAAQEKAKAAGIWSPQLPPELGGMGLTLTEIIPVFEAAGRSLLGPLVLNCAAPDEGNMHLLLEYGTDAQIDDYLRPLAAGDTRSGFAMTEPAPGAGSDPGMLLTTAVRDGDDWVINGHKWWTTGAGNAAFLIIMARTNPDVPVHKGATMLLAPITAPGIELVRLIPIVGEEGFGGHGEIKFHDLRVPNSAILGKEGEGYALTQARLGPARLTHCMRWTGIAQRAMEIAAAYASKREAFGKALSDHQSIQWMLADSATELHAGRLMMYQAAWMLEHGDPARNETSMCKVFIAETVNRVIDRAIQICGGMGISRDLPLSTWYSAARAFRIYDGASEVHRMVIARSVLKQFGSKPKE